MVRCYTKLENNNKNSKYINKTKNLKKSRNIQLHGVLNIKWMFNDV